MKYITAVGSLLAGVSVASPLTFSKKVYGREVKVTPQKLETFKTYVQWASAAICNDELAPGERLVCNGGGCPEVNATMVRTLKGPSTDITGFVAQDPSNSQVVVSFRGSHNWINWITDLEFSRVNCNLGQYFGDNCKVHRGFQKAWNEVSTDVQEAVDETLKSGWSLVFTGHSMGAAVATLGAAVFRKMNYDLDLYTFGSPRVVNPEFAEAISAEGNNYRFTHSDDWVPRLPFEWQGYQHVDPEYWIADKPAQGEYSVQDITVCTSKNRNACNAGEWTWSRAAHGYYFQQMDGCGNNPSDFISEEEFDAIKEYFGKNLNRNETIIEARN